jgi:alkaline phosphatase
MDGKKPATDSASPATPMATGHKTDAGNIAWASGDLEGGELETVAEKLRADKGYAIGVVSTVPFNHPRRPALRRSSPRR